MSCRALPCALPLTAPPWLDAGVHEGRGDLRHPEHHALREEAQEKPGHRRCADPEGPGPAKCFQERRREVALPRHLQGRMCTVGLLVGYWSTVDFAAAGPDRPRSAKRFQECRPEVALPRHLQGTIQYWYDQQ